MNVRPLLNESDLDWALAEIDAYFDKQPEPDSAEAARFNVRAARIENYEDRHWPIDPLASVRPVRRYKLAGGELKRPRKLPRHRAG